MYETSRSSLKAPGRQQVARFTNSTYHSFFTKSRPSNGFSRARKYSAPSHPSHANDRAYSTPQPSRSQGRSWQPEGNDFIDSEGSHENASGKTPGATKKEPWMIQKAALQKKFKEGWNPRKKLSPDALDGIRALHAGQPDVYTTEILAKEFEVSPESIRRILKSKWRPNAKEAESRQSRWERRGNSIWYARERLNWDVPRRWRETIMAARLSSRDAEVQLKEHPVAKAIITRIPEQRAKMREEQAKYLAEKEKEEALEAQKKARSSGKRKPYES